MLDLAGLVVAHDARKRLQELARSPSHATVIAGAQGIGKSLVAQRVAAAWLGVDWRTLDQSQYVRIIVPEKSSISIEQIRSLRPFLQLKESRQGEIKRVVMIIDAHAMTIPAQNALLKLLEEPPADTVLLLTSSNPRGLLPTILSRVQSLHLPTPPLSEVTTGLTYQISSEELRRLYALSDGNIAEIVRLLAGAEEGVNTLELAKQILASGRFERLCMIDKELKDREVAQDVAKTLARIASSALARNSASPNTTAQWHRILKASILADESLAKNTSSKLALTELMLSL